MNCQLQDPRETEQKCESTKMIESMEQDQFEIETRNKVYSSGKIEQDTTKEEFYACE